MDLRGQYRVKRGHVAQWAGHQARCKDAWALYLGCVTLGKSLHLSMPVSAQPLYAAWSKDHLSLCACAVLTTGLQPGCGWGCDPHNVSLPLPATDLPSLLTAGHCLDG